MTTFVSIFCILIYQIDKYNPEMPLSFQRTTIQLTHKFNELTCEVVRSKNPPHFFRQQCRQMTPLPQKNKTPLNNNLNKSLYSKGH